MQVQIELNCNTYVRKIYREYLTIIFQAIEIRHVLSTKLVHPRRPWALLRALGGLSETPT